MSEEVLLIVIGIFSGIFVLALKAGIGCGLSNLRNKEISFIALLYFLLSFIISQLVGIFPIGAKDFILGNYNIHFAFFILLSMIMVGVGIHTVREWNLKRHDITRYSFLPISIPCPFCLAAILLSSTILASYTSLNNHLIGTLIGSSFFTMIIVSSFLLRRFKKSPLGLGNAMIYIGGFYLLSSLIIPAYIRAKSVEIVPLSISLPLDKLLFFFSFAIALFLIGFLGHKNREKEVRKCYQVSC